MRLLIALTLVVGASGYFGWGPFARDRVKGLAQIKVVPLTEAAATEDPCTRVKRCVIVYVAPWCPSCKQARPLIRALRTKLPGQGAALKIVVGMSDRARAQELAGELGGPVFFDPDGDYYRAIKATGVPFWLTLDRGQEVRARMAGFVTPLEAQLTRLGF